MKKIISQILGIVLGLFVFSSGASAAGNMHIGSMEIHPISAVKYIFNDNIYTELKNDANGDQITNYQLGLLLKKPIKPG